MTSKSNSAVTTERFDKGHALLVGIANYDVIGKLPPTVLKDAQDVSTLLRSADHCGYPEDQVRQLTDNLATANGIRDGLRWLAKQTSKDDTAVFFFSGHGGRLVEGGMEHTYLLPVEADPSNLVATTLSGEEIAHLVQAIPAGRILIIFDCCHAGGIGDIKAFDIQSGQFKSGLDETFYSHLGEGQGRAILASSRTDEVSWVLPDLDNSLFTHYLLEALRGKAPTKGDGRIRIFDIFDYVSEQVPARHPFQHPIFKARLENNFPVALYQGQKITVTEKPYIQNIKRLPLSPAEHEVLAGMFKDYERLTLKHEFGEGFSGSRVFLVRPIRNANEAELPAVVKTGPVELVQQEKQAFSKLVQHKLPNAIWIVDGAVSRDNRWAGLRYPLAGDGQFTIESLKSYVRHAPVEDVLYVLQERLFKSLRTVWQKQLAHEFYWRDSYDYLLPVNLFIEEADEPADGQKPDLTPKTAGKIYEPGHKVILADFLITEIDVKSKTITLNLLPSDQQQIIPSTYRMRVKVKDVETYQVGETLTEPLTGRVLNTRHSLLQQYAATALGNDIHITSASVALAKEVWLPNPIELLPSLLERTSDVCLSPIHGDLNLENVLVEYDAQSYNVHLIDFASTRQDHVLHDLLRLESGLLLALLPPTLAVSNLPATTVVSFLEALHHDRPVLPGLEKPFAIIQAMRKEAESYLHPTGEWHQYYEGLAIYLLGALKYGNLDKEKIVPAPKQVAFWGAAGALMIRHQPQITKPVTPTGATANKEDYMSNRKRRVVRVKAEGVEGSKILTSGERITVGGSPMDHRKQDVESADVIVDLKNIKNAQIFTAGDEIALLNAVAEPLDELVGLLTENLVSENDRADIQDVAAELLAEAQKQPQQQDSNKVARALRWLERYIGLATLAAAQVEKAQQLIDKVQQLLARI